MQHRRLQIVKVKISQIDFYHSRPRSQIINFQIEMRYGLNYSDIEKGVFFIGAELNST